jgi:hypothetical protein
MSKHLKMMHKNTKFSLSKENPSVFMLYNRLSSTSISPLLHITLDHFLKL